MSSEKLQLLGSYALTGFQGLQNVIERQSSRRKLGRLDQRLLNDVGLTQTQAARESKKPFWKG